MLVDILWISQQRIIQIFRGSRGALNDEVQLQRTMLRSPLAVGEESLPDSKLVFAENGRCISDFRLKFYKRSSDDLHLLDEQQILYLSLVYQTQRSRCIRPGLNYVLLFVDQHHV
ncbi:hypothetical protein TNCV_1824581 [Trichonephila clavipes]|nr:hypothetical protein TNCV_1824581 [Trichonephila clavipes]